MKTIKWKHFKSNCLKYPYSKITNTLLIKIGLTNPILNGGPPTNPISLHLFFFFNKINCFHFIALKLRSSYISNQLAFQKILWVFNQVSHSTCKISPTNDNLTWTMVKYSIFSKSLILIQYLVLLLTSIR